MTEHEFEDARAHLWHSILKNDVLLLLLPSNLAWNEFHTKVRMARDNGRKVDWPMINPDSESVKRAAACWLGDGKPGQDAGKAILDFVGMFDRVEYLRPISNRQPGSGEVTAWVHSCSEAMRRTRTARTPLPGGDFWESAFLIAFHLQDLEQGSPGFWRHFEHDF